MDPKLDGINHINIYSAGKTELGKFLSNFAYSPITIGDDGHFDSIEGYWYWLSNRQDVMRSTQGYNAKKVGKSYPRIVQLEEEVFKRKIIEACWIKIHSNPHKLKIFKDSTLPFTHYYVFNGSVKDAGFKWIIDMWELFRTNIRKEVDPMFKVIIAGGRDFGNTKFRGQAQAEKDFTTLYVTMDALLKNKPSVTIISGGARGTDALGERYAKLRGYPLIVMKADWDKYGKRAGYIRNADMLEIANAAVCFWNGISKGTFHMIDIIKTSGKPWRVVNYMKELFFIVPKNEIRGLKELRVSPLIYTFWRCGPISGAKDFNGTPLEDLDFNTAEEAWEAINKFALHLAP